MTSPPALLYDTCYHIYNRGINRANIFVQERNYEHFMHLYHNYIDPVADTFAYCLLRNHFHLLVRIKSSEEIETLRVSFANHDPIRKRHPEDPDVDRARKSQGSDQPSKKFSDFFNAYAKAINKAYGRTGSLFQHPFGRILVASGRQFWNVVAYIHQNPQKHGLVTDFRDWKYSSYGLLLSDQPTRLGRNCVLDWFGGQEGYLKKHGKWISDAESQWFVEADYD